MYPKAYIYQHNCGIYLSSIYFHAYIAYLGPIFEWENLTPVRSVRRNWCKKQIGALYPVYQQYVHGLTQRTQLYFIYFRINTELAFHLGVYTLLMGKKGGIYMKLWSSKVT